MGEPEPADDPITLRLQVAQTIIHQCLHNLRELANVLALLAAEAHERGVVSEESFETVIPSLKELDMLLTRGLEFFEPKPPPAIS